VAAPIVLSNVSKSYETPPVFVVRDLSLSINEGEFFCLVGPSGCGKSTALKMIAGIEAPTRGTVVRPAQVGMVFQSYALLPWLTVEDNVAFPARMQNVKEDDVKKLTEEYLHMVHLEAFAKKYPRELSGGQRQRVGIARALAVGAGALLLDEPFSALDPVITEELHKDLLQIWQATKKTVVMVSHHFDEAVVLADRVGIMRDGVLEDVVSIALARPRNEDDIPFMLEVKKLRQSFSGSPGIAGIAQRSQC
jgi:NitT/TauT family transport system ATP-binding protein